MLYLQWFFQIVKMKIAIYKLENIFVGYIPENEDDLLISIKIIEEGFNILENLLYKGYTYNRFECWIIDSFYDAYCCFKNIERRLLLMH